MDATAQPTQPQARHFIHPGDQFGRLTVLHMTDGATAKDRYWLCRCECGTETRVKGHKLNSGHTKSCGCYNRRPGKNRTHGQSGWSGPRTTEYRSWTMMRNRCKNPNTKGYEYYGGRGITICARWERFEDFLEDMGQKPSPSHSIERIDNNGNYEPGNCRWATKGEQSRNRRNAVLLTHDGITLNLVDWAKRRGLARACLAERLKLGWSVSEALGFTERAKYGARSRPFSPQVRIGMKK